MYPFYFKQIEKDKRTDKHFFKLLSVKSYIEIYFADDGDVHLTKTNMHHIKDFSTKKHFADRHAYIAIDSEVFANQIERAIRCFEGKEPLESKTQNIKTVILESHLEKAKNECQNALNNINKLINYIQPESK